MSGLTTTQAQILEALAGLDPPWVLFGGAALIGYVLHHRTTKDLDLSFRDRTQLGDAPVRVQERLRERGFVVSPLQTAPAFRRLRVERGGDVVVLDLVAERVTVVEPPVQVAPGILVDSPRELLVQKLCALLSRSEVRDLVDVMALVRAGHDLKRAVRDAPTHDGGFSPPTLAWVLQSFPLAAAATLGFDVRELARARDELVQILLAD